MSPSDRAFQKLLEQARGDPYVVGLFLSGSRGKGFETEGSDYDVNFVLQGEVTDAYRARYPWEGLPGIQCVLYSYKAFQQYAAYGSEDAWDRPDFAHVEALLDKNGQIQRLIDEKGRLPESERWPLVRASLDALINSVYRSVKSFRKGQRLGARLEAADGLSHLLTLIFALEGRHRPFFGYLEQELEKRPLETFPIDRSELMNSIERVLTTGDVGTQQTLLVAVEQVTRAVGLGDIYDDWGDAYLWLKTSKLEP